MSSFSDRFDLRVSQLVDYFISKTLRAMEISSGKKSVRREVLGRS